MLTDVRSRSSVQGIRVDSTGHHDSYVLNADLALLLCARVWGGSETDAPWTEIGNRLEPSWRARLEARANGLDQLDADRARAVLTTSHRDQLRVDHDRVHQSWWVRALKDESPAVRRLLAQHGPFPARQTVAEPTAEPASAASPHAEAREWALALWSERLVGGEPPRPVDLPVIRALAECSAPLLYRLCHATGVALAALAGDPEGRLADQSTLRAQQRWYDAWFAREAGQDSAPLGATARNELANARIERDLGPRRRLATAGLLVIARLLTAAEDHRVRWALQQVPYPIAKRIRAVMARTKSLAADQLSFESILLRAAWEWLVQGGAVALPVPRVEAGRQEDRHGD